MSINESMTDDEVSATYRFTDPVDIPTALDSVDIEHLEVSEQRTIIIYNRTIVDCEVINHQLDTAHTIIISIFDIGPTVDSDPMDLIDDLINDISRSDWNRLED